MARRGSSVSPELIQGCPPFPFRLDKRRAFRILNRVDVLITQNNIKREINPDSLLRFMESMSWDIDTYASFLLDVDKIDNLIEELKSFYGF